MVHNKGHRKFRTPAEAARQRARTSRNKIRAVTKALLTAGGKQIDFLKTRLVHWEKNLS